MLIPFEVTHLDGFIPRNEECDMFKLEDITERIEAMANEGEAFTFIKEGRVIAFGGIYEKWKGNAEVWMIPCPDFKQYQLEACKHLKGLFKRWFSMFNRVQTISLNDTLHHRFMTFLELEREGILKSFGPGGENYAIYAKVGI